ncbi:hypothetical protein D3C72_1428260 [compost metagenome]
MREPGASEVLMCGCTFRPASTAFLARMPAASITLGLEVLVHEVMAAMSTSPLPMVTSPLGADGAVALVWAAALVERLATISMTGRGEPGGGGGTSVSPLWPSRVSA